MQRAFLAACAVFVVQDPANNGLGDNLTRLQMSMAVARSLGGKVLLPDASWEVPPHHRLHGDSLYGAVDALLGLRALQNVSALRASVRGLVVEATGVSPLRAAEEAAQLCSAPGLTVVLHLASDVCPQWRHAWQRPFVPPAFSWCPLDPRVPGADTVSDQLRAVGSAATVGWALRFFDPSAINVAIHVRNGDVCVNCRLVNARGLDYRLVMRTIRSAFRCGLINTVFFTQNELPWVAGAFPGARVVTASDAGVAEAVAHMLGAHVLVATGSSLPTAAAAFSPSPRHPVVLEGMTKESVWGKPGRTHVLPADQALRLNRRGQLIDGNARELRRRVGLC
jgi:hypothetical protein